MSRPLLELVVGTSNKAKIREINDALRNLPIMLRYLHEFPRLVTPEEVGGTYEENATLKALSYSNQTCIAALADDSGLEVDALEGRPGVRSARYGGDGLSDEQRTARLLSELDSHQNRKARFVCVMVIAAPNPHGVIYVARGECEGVIAEHPRGMNGFGYDPVFIPTGYDQTFGELPDEVKRVISHRARALAQTREFLEGWIRQT